MLAHGDRIAAIDRHVDCRRLVVSKFINLKSSGYSTFVYQNSRWREIFNFPPATNYFRNPAALLNAHEIV